MSLLLPSLLFTFFYTYVFQYIIQTTPCFGLQNTAYPKFTSVQTILNGDVGNLFFILGQFFLKVFLTVVLWAILMFGFGFMTFYYRKVSNNMFQWIGIVPTVAVMLVFTLVCRAGFGNSLPIEPTWTYKINLDIISHHFGLFGFFPEVLWLVVLLGGVFIDFIFWVFLKIGLTPA